MRRPQRRGGFADGRGVPEDPAADPHRARSRRCVCVWGEGMLWHCTGAKSPNSWKHPILAQGLRSVWIRVAHRQGGGRGSSTELLGSSQQLSPRPATSPFKILLTTSPSKARFLKIRHADRSVSTFNHVCPTAPPRRRRIPDPGYEARPLPQSQNRPASPHRQRCCAMGRKA